MNGTVKLLGGASALVLAIFGMAFATGQWLGEEPARDAAHAAIVPLSAQAMLAAGDDEALPSVETARQAQAEAAEHLRSDPFVIKRILPINGPIRYGEWHWDETGVPETGELIITVDLEARVISVFRDGYEIGAAAVLLGTDEHPTPLGVFPVLQKKRHNISSIYHVPMPYTMRLTWDGIAIHSSEVENGYASHGCIGTPDEFAARLFAIVDKGDIVIITRGKRIGLGDRLIQS